MINQPGDVYEQEADQVAEMVMRFTDPPDALMNDAGHRAAHAARGATMWKSGKETPAIQAQEQPGFASTVSPHSRAKIDGSLSGGQPLSSSERAFFEPRFGRDFTGIQLHTDARAAEAAGAVRARAFTLGSHIVFGSGQYEPQTLEGKRLLAHELTHTLQQLSARAVMREAEEAEPAAPVSQDLLPASGFIEGPPEQSARIPQWVLATAGPASSSLPGLEEAGFVSRSEVDSSCRVSPEQDALSETPYETGMSPMQLRNDLRQGDPLDPTTRESMESLYGPSLDHVRIHTDSKAASLCDRFKARAFAFENHIAFGDNQYAPQTETGRQLLRHEVTHTLQAKSAPPAAVHRAGACATTCAPGTAGPFTPTSDTTFNCYAYAMNRPGSGFLQPGQDANTNEYRAAVLSDPAAIAAIGGPAKVRDYFTPAGMLRNMTADRGAPLSTNCSNCCPSSKRKVIAVTTDPISITGANWDHHWYRKDSDRTWSHKPGSTPSRQDDASGMAPICNPCTSDRNFSPLNYKHVVGSWCV